jgi:hypothetical protein
MQPRKKPCSLSVNLFGFTIQQNGTLCRERCDGGETFSIAVTEVLNPIYLPLLLK